MTGGVGMNIAVAQMAISESLEQNTARIIGFMEKAGKLEAELICFPEMCLTGYSPGLLQQKDFTSQVEGALERLGKACRQLNLAAIVGHAHLEQGHRYNRATVLLPSSGLYFYDKQFLTEPEEKYFCPGSQNTLFTYRDTSFGLIICRDQNYPLLARELKEMGAGAMFILAAHYYSPREARWKLEKNRAIPITRAVENKFHVFMANTVGTHLGMISLGNSLIAEPGGAVVASAGETEESIIFFDIDYRLEEQIVAE